MRTHAHDVLVWLRVCTSDPLAWGGLGLDAVAARLHAVDMQNTFAAVQTKCRALRVGRFRSAVPLLQQHSSAVHTGACPRFSLRACPRFSLPNSRFSVWEPLGAAFHPQECC